ncbi:ABC transporter permease subunit [Aquabacterium sp. CECT 9606]|uniref:ABC transporter permease subunit n=1 Tax=Aquabacterium sp. CECT 9606 TaxID=2845822 RepID=UPI001E403CD0|nr:ABC transporter permease subunit [Aquabacterium sp. CECT 9606]CAH0352873.1 putative glutamine ABC transporter permease protein GlnM [Aquabacterium sp. CECT 9606]
MLDFLNQPAGFGIGETGLLVYDASQPLWRAMAVGLGNTLRVSLPALVFATALGTLVALSRRAAHPGLRTAGQVYIDVVRNVPLLVQLLMWYFLLLDWLPDTTLALGWLPGVTLSKGGLSFPWLAADHSGWLWSLPAQDGLSVTGGATVTPEYLAVFMALVTYTAAFVAEVVRAGLESVPKSLSEAALTLGALPHQVMLRVVLPQALRTMVPAMTNQYLNLVKNSSLAVAVGYPDLVSVGNTALNQTGRAVECILVMMSVYLTLSLLTAALMNWFNTRYALRGSA